MPDDYSNSLFAPIKYQERPSVESAPLLYRFSKHWTL